VVLSPLSGDPRASIEDIEVLVWIAPGIAEIAIPDLGEIRGERGVVHDVLADVGVHLSNIGENLGDSHAFRVPEEARNDNHREGANQRADDHQLDQGEPRPRISGSTSRRPRRPSEESM